MLFAPVRVIKALPVFIKGLISAPFLCRERLSELGAGYDCPCLQPALCPEPSPAGPKGFPAGKAGCEVQPDFLVLLLKDLCCY